MREVRLPWFLAPLIALVAAEQRNIVTPVALPELRVEKAGRYFLPGWSTMLVRTVLVAGYWIDTQGLMQCK